ncbi:MAG: NTP transferase domain-containing protein [Thermodesulfobacteriota bacterium]|nr:NTP transferase domain-containing protein [Thermodesulfobacteriota bacterium]
MEKVSVIILAAGKGTRMKSDRAKVLHELGGIPMIRYVVHTALAVVKDVVVVIGHQAESVRRVLSDFPSLLFAVQEEQLGTGHAVMTAMPLIADTMRDAVILCGDTPLIQAQTIEVLIKEHRARQVDLTVATTRLDEPFGYGRIICDAQRRVMRIVEEADASDSEKKIDTVNSGTYCAKAAFLRRFLPDLRDDNAQSEFYLTDVVEKAYQRGIPAAVVDVSNSLEVLGVNTMDDLARAEASCREMVDHGG